MGFGGITALGCTIGQGVTGLSTLSVGSALATVSIVAGARAGLYLLVERKWTFGNVRPRARCRPKPRSCMSGSAARTLRA